MQHSADDGPAISRRLEELRKEREELAKARVDDPEPPPPEPKCLCTLNVIHPDCPVHNSRDGA